MSRSSGYGDYRDDRGPRWEGGAEEPYAFGGATGLYRTDDRSYHDRYREHVDRRDRAVRDHDDYLRESGRRNATWGEPTFSDRDEPQPWGPRERGGYWRRYESQRPDFVGRGPKGYQRSDDRILEEVCDRMTEDPLLDASEISVDVRQGEVVLTGTVTSRDQKRRADSLADCVSGVKDVTNQLRVMRSGQWHDAPENGNETPSKSTSISTT